MTPAQVAHIIALVQQHAAACLNGLPTTHKLFEQIQAALRDAPQQAEPIALCLIGISSGKPHLSDFGANFRPLHKRSELEEVQNRMGWDFGVPRIAEVYALPLNTPSAPQQADGWVMVPVEPTPEMVTAAFCGGHGSGPAADWPAMLAARPSAPTAVEPDERAERDKQHRDLFFAAYQLLDGVCEDHPALADVLNVDAHGALCHALAQLDVFYGINGPEDIAPPIKAEPGSRLEYELHVLNSKASASKGTP